MDPCDLRTVEFLKIRLLGQKLWPKNWEKNHFFYFSKFSIFSLVFRQKTIFLKRTDGFQPNLVSRFICKSSTRNHLKINFSIDSGIFRPNNFDEKKNWPAAGIKFFFGFYDIESYLLEFIYDLLDILYNLVPLVI